MTADVPCEIRQRSEVEALGDVCDALGFVTKLSGYIKAGESVDPPACSDAGDLSADLGKMLRGDT